MKEFFYIAFTVIFVIIYPILQQRIKDDRSKSILFWVYIPLASLYVLIIIYLVMVGKQLEDKVTFLEDKPGFHEEMWSMITGIPAEAVNKMHKAADAYNAHEYDTAFKHIQKAISMLEKETGPDFKKYVQSQFREKAGAMYQLGAKITGRLKQRKLAYQYAKKTVELVPSYYNYYVLAVASYNVKKYKEANDNCDLALDKGPPQSIYGELTEIKKRALAHLEKN